MMRVENLTDLAALLRSIDNGPDSEMGFDMQRQYRFADLSDHPCGTACCIGGWVHASRKDLSRVSLSGAVSALGCSQKEANNLCWAMDPERELIDEAFDATPEQAACAVEILRDTGKCDWPRALREGAAQ